MRSAAAVALVLLAAATHRSVAAPSTARCGRHLADLLAVVCQDSGYNSPLNNVPPTPPLQAGEKLSRARRGVVEECCRASCTLSTLQQYCNEPASAQAHSRPEETNLVEPTRKSKVRHRDSGKKARGHKRKKKGKRGNGKCRCARRQRRRKLERARVERKMRDAPDFQIGTVASPFMGVPVIVPQLRRSPNKGI